MVGLDLAWRGGESTEAALVDVAQTAPHAAHEAAAGAVAKEKHADHGKENRDLVRAVIPVEVVDVRAVHLSRKHTMCVCV
jgi:hypothetical protein